MYINCVVTSMDDIIMEKCCESTLNLLKEIVHDLYWPEMRQSVIMETDIEADIHGRCPTCGKELILPL